MKPSSAKNKGRLAQRAVVAAILAKYPGLHPDDVQWRSMGAPGEDIMLSPAARGKLPLSIEVKAVEKLSIWDALAQAKANAKQHKPAVVFKRNRSELFIALSLSDFLDLLP